MEITILGSTGSIGKQTLEIAKNQGWKIKGLVAGNNIELLKQQVIDFKPEFISAKDEKTLSRFLKSINSKTKIKHKEEIILEKVDVIVNAIGGMSGIQPTKAALENGQKIALATKEAMVAAHSLIWQAAKNGNGSLVPIDSEHTGVYQCLVGENLNNLSEIILTASGGPFFKTNKSLDEITPKEALKHPNWSMGRKISIDSATFANKGLEVMECSALYGISLDKVKVLIHPQSKVHALIRWSDGNLTGNISNTDMKLSISYAVKAAKNGGMSFAGDIKSTDRIIDIQAQNWSLIGDWQFLEPDFKRFPCLELAYWAGKKGNIFPAIYNISDEIAVNLFLNKQIKFTDIAKIIENSLENAPNYELSWENLEKCIIWTKEHIKNNLNNIKG